MNSYTTMAVAPPNPIRIARFGRKPLYTADVPSSRHQRQRLQRVSVFQFSSIVPMYLTLTLENGTFTTSNGALKHVANIAPTKPLPNVCTDDSSAEDVGGSACRIRSMSPKYTAFHTQLRHRVGLSPIMKNAFEPPSATSFRQQSNAPE